MIFQFQFSVQYNRSDKINTSLDTDFESKLEFDPKFVEFNQKMTKNNMILVVIFNIFRHFRLILTILIV